jgi:hypothetical protein
MREVPVGTGFRREQRFDTSFSGGRAGTALRVGWRVVLFEVVIQGGLVFLRQLLAMHLDVRRRPHLLFGHFDLQVIGTNVDSAQRHESEMAADKAFLHRGKLRLVCLDVNVDILQLADLFAVPIHQHLPVPFGGAPFRLFLIFVHLHLPAIGSARLALCGHDPPTHNVHLSFRSHRRALEWRALGPKVFSSGMGTKWLGIFG